MAKYETEEEQLNALKEWWKENGRSVVAGIIIGVGGLIGWKSWGSYQEQQAMEASDRYMQMSVAVRQQQVDEVIRHADNLKTQYKDTPYAVLGALTLAKIKAEIGDDQAAQENLQWAIQHAKQEHIRHLAQLRLARIYIAQKEWDAAQALLSEDYAVAYHSLRDEISGDLYVALGEVEKARAAYEQALSTIGTNDTKFLQMKLDDLGKA